jgi:serine/threonine protein kinase
MPLAAGTRLGNYEIVGPLGAGGMGEIYRAKDTKLDREVAIKVLPPAYAQHPERLARFEREAKVLASLDHRNIATIYAVEESPDGKALVMELVKGQTLKGPVPLDTALKYAAEIASALDAAHEKGITHRDLKPANIIVTPDGTIKVLDFGLAAVTQPSQREGEIGTNVATLSMSPTQAGMIMGTAAYMSPEQARGQTVDRRADIFSFGVVLYEMLTGRQLFHGETVSDILASVLKEDPSLDDVPEQVRPLLKRCLEKDPKKRLQAIGDWDLLLASGASSPALPAPSQSRSHAVSIVAALATLAAIGLGVVHFRETPPEAPLIQTTILPPEKTQFNFATNWGPMAISPDGKRLVFTATGENNKSQLWIRPLDSAVARSLDGTDGARWPFWSPDGRYVAFFADGKLKKIDTAGGPALAMADVPNARGGAWSPEGVILFQTNNGNPPLSVIASTGSTVTEATKLDDSKGINPRFPWFLPDGKHYLFATERRGFGARENILVGTLGSFETKIIAQADSNAVYSAGHLLFLREDTLLAQPFDLKALAASGEASPVVEHVESALNPGTFGFFTVSATGTLAYQTGRGAQGLQLTWFDRTGKVVGTVGTPRDFSTIDLSPDRKTLAVGGRVGTNLDIWLFDVTRGLPTRFTFDPADESDPVWSPDGKTIAFYSARKGKRDLYRKAADGTAPRNSCMRIHSRKFRTVGPPTGGSCYLRGAATYGLCRSGSVAPFRSSRPRSCGPRLSLRLIHSFRRMAAGSRMPPMNPAASRFMPHLSRGRAASARFRRAAGCFPAGGRMAGNFSIFPTDSSRPRK